MMSEEELQRPSDQINFKVQVNGQVQVLVHLHCNAQIRPKSVQCLIHSGSGVCKTAHLHQSLFKRPKKYMFIKVS